jgi:NTE family protein
MHSDMIFSATKRLQADMDAATSYDEWKDAAIAHDEASGVAKWKKSDESKHFDYVSIRKRLNKLRRLRSKGDCPRVLFALNEGIHGNIDGMGHARLHGKAKFGTKRLIDDYVSEVVAALDLIGAADEDEIPFDERLDFFRRAQHCNGRSALMMSGAGSLLFFHVGVVKTLWQFGLLPGVLSGASGGAIVGSIVSTHVDKDLERIFEPDNLVHEIERDQGLLSHLSALKPEIAKAEEIQEVLERLNPDLTFLEAFECTGRHLNVSIAAAEKHQTSRLLNAITTPNVYVREAVMASAAIPGFFPPVTLAAKNDRGKRQPYLPTRKWVDGSLSDDLPTKRLARVYGVNHFIVSQVNPHVFPFVTDIEGEKTVLSTVKHATKQTAREWINAGASLIEKPLAVSPMVSRLTNVALGIINQDYVGDINILPDQRFFNPLKWLAHRSADEIVDLIAMGERATWPKIEQIRIQTKISRRLNQILGQLDRRLPPVGSNITRRAG